MVQVGLSETSHVSRLPIMWEMSDIMAIEDLRGDALYKALMDMKPAGMSEADWAVRAGKSRGYFTDLKTKNLRPRIDTLSALLAIVGGATTVRSLGDKVTPLQEAERAPKPFAIGELPRDVPILGTAQGAMLTVRKGEDGVEVERTVIEQEPLGFARRPPSLTRNLKVYALYVTGHSMEPRFRPGDLVYVDARREASVGDDVVVQLIEDMPPEADAPQVQSVLVKTLTRRTASEIELQQYSPDAIFRIERRRVHTIHRVIPLSELMS